MEEVHAPLPGKLWLGGPFLCSVVPGPCVTLCVHQRSEGCWLQNILIFCPSASCFIAMELSLARPPSTWSVEVWSVDTVMWVCVEFWGENAKLCWALTKTLTKASPVQAEPR